MAISALGNRSHRSGGDRTGGLGATTGCVRSIRDATSATYPAGWDADMEDLWRPLVETKRPLILAIEDPLFAELNGSTETYFRDRTLNNWNDIASSPTVAALRTC